MFHLSQWYSRCYAALCGTHPNERFWHFQWLSSYALHRDLQELLPTLSGNVLDIGCGEKPYWGWFKRDMTRAGSANIGIDISASRRADVVFNRDSEWPLKSNQFDSALCTQVIQYVQNLPLFISEIGRVLKPGGQLVLTAPFIYNDNPQTLDSWRVTPQGVKQLFQKEFEITEMRQQGGVGSTLGLLLLNWIECQTCRYRVTRFLKALLLPVYIPVCAVVNALGWSLDRLDTTGVFYSNLLIRLKRRE